MPKGITKAPAKSIVCFPIGENQWRINIDGKTHPSDFVSSQDCRLWVGNMWEHGFYTERPLYVMTQTGALNPTTPLYAD